MTFASRLAAVALAALIGLAVPASAQQAPAEPKPALSVTTRAADITSFLREAFPHALVTSG